MRILGVGNDLIAVSRIADAMRRHGEQFLKKILSESERQICITHHHAASRHQHVAGRFAAKEAIVKALGTGFQEGITWQDIHILPDARGKPEVHFSSGLLTLFGPLVCHLSISHCHDYAIATAIVLVEENV